MSYQVDLIPIVFCVLKQGKVIKLPEIIPALNPYTDYWIEMSCDGNYHTTKYDNKYPLAEYSILNNDEQPCSWKIGNYKVTDIRDNMNYQFNYTTIYTIMDSNQKSYTLMLRNTGSNDFINSRHSIEDVYEILRNLSRRFVTWNDFNEATDEEVNRFVEKFKETDQHENYDNLKIIKRHLNEEKQQNAWP